MAKMIDETEANYRALFYAIGTACVTIAAAVAANGVRALRHYHVYWVAAVIWTTLLAVSLGIAVGAVTYLVQWEYNRRCERDANDPDYFLRSPGASARRFRAGR